MNNTTGRIYHLEFLTRRGCELGVLAEMARYDSADVLSSASDLTCEGTNVRFATLQSRPFSGQPRGADPTMARWASFAVGARLVHRFFYSYDQDRTVSVLAPDVEEALQRARSLGHNPLFFQLEQQTRTGQLTCTTVSAPVTAMKAVPDQVFSVRDASGEQIWRCMVDGKIYGDWTQRGPAEAGLKVEQARATRRKARVP